jgi:hypothetical protein
MTASEFSEIVIEQAALAWLEGLGYEILSGPEIATGVNAGFLEDRATASEQKLFANSVTGCVLPP